MIKESKGRIVFRVFNVLVMLVMMLVTLYPLLYVVFASFSNADEFVRHSGILLKPLGFSVEAYKRAFVHPQIMSGYKNTIFIVAVGLVISMLLTSVGAYFLSAKNVLLQKYISFFIIFTMFFHGGMIPFYFAVKDFGITIPWIAGGKLVMQNIGIYNTLWAVIIPVAISTYNLIVMRTGFASVPESLIEAAQIDGSGHIRTLFKVVIPLAKPTFMVIALYYGVSYWNSWFNASIFLNDADKYPLQLVLRTILMTNDTANMTMGVDSGKQLSISETIKYAVIVIATVPMLCVYPFIQKYFMKGVMLGAVKG